MKIGGIIAEYNPFHNGHKYHIEEFKEKSSCSHLVAVTSGNFVQRGGPAIVDKYTRAKMALDNGVDLVLEMPAYYATQTAEIFSRGAVMTLEALNCVDSFCFGSEHGEIDKLKEAAAISMGISGDYEVSLRKNIEEGMPFAVAREMAVREYMDEVPSDFFKGSNNILAIEYLRELIRLDSKMEPITIRRMSAGHNSRKVSGDISSATAIRKVLNGLELRENVMNTKDKRDFLRKISIIENSVPKTIYFELIDMISKEMYPLDNEDFFSEIRTCVIRNEGTLHNYFEVKEGLENSIRKTVVRVPRFDDVVAELRSKRYTSSKIRRCLFNILLGVKDRDMDIAKNLKQLPYVRVLALNDKGREILKKIKEVSDVDVVSSPAKAKLTDSYIENPVYKMLFDFDLRSSSIYYQKYYSNHREQLENGEVDYFNLITRLEQKNDID